MEKETSRSVKWCASYVGGEDANCMVVLVWWERGKKKETRAPRIKERKTLCGPCNLQPATPQVSLLLSCLAGIGIGKWGGLILLTEAPNGNEHELVDLYELES